MSITKVVERSMKLVSNESIQKNTAESPKPTPIGIATAKDSMEINVKQQEQFADDAKSMYEDSKELFKKAIKTLTEAEERKSQVISKLD
jgi:hypothetical protein